MAFGLEDWSGEAAGHCICDWSRLGPGMVDGFGTWEMQVGKFSSRKQRLNGLEDGANLHLIGSLQCFPYQKVMVAFIPAALVPDRYTRKAGTWVSRADNINNFASNKLWAAMLSTNGNARLHNMTYSALCHSKALSSYISCLTRMNEISFCISNDVCGIAAPRTLRRVDGFNEI